MGGMIIAHWNSQWT